MRYFSFISLLLVLTSSFFSQSNLRAAEEISESGGAFHPPAIRQGFYTGLSTGKLYFTGNDRSLYKEGWVVGFKFGYDIMKYLGAEAIYKLSGHTSTSGTAVSTLAKGFFVHQLILQGKGSYPVTQRLHVSLGLGGGLFESSPNFNKNGDVHRTMFYGELGALYFMRTRGISIGIDPSFAAVRNLNSVVLQATGFVRYTF